MWHFSFPQSTCVAENSIHSKYCSSNINIWKKIRTLQINIVMTKNLFLAYLHSKFLVGDRTSCYYVLFFKKNWQICQLTIKTKSFLYIWYYVSLVLIPTPPKDRFLQYTLNAKKRQVSTVYIQYTKCERKCNVFLFFLSIQYTHQSIFTYVYKYSMSTLR